MFYFRSTPDELQLDPIVPHYAIVRLWDTDTDDSDVEVSSEDDDFNFFPEVEQFPLPLYAEPVFIGIPEEVRVLDDILELYSEGDSVSDLSLDWDYEATAETTLGTSLSVNADMSDEGEFYVMGQPEIEGDNRVPPEEERQANAEALENERHHGDEGAAMKEEEKAAPLAEEELFDSSTPSLSSLEDLGLSEISASLASLLEDDDVNLPELSSPEPALQEQLEEAAMEEGAAAMVENIPPNNEPMLQIRAPGVEPCRAGMPFIDVPNSNRWRRVLEPELPVNPGVPVVMLPCPPEHPGNDIRILPISGSVMAQVIPAEGEACYFHNHPFTPDVRHRGRPAMVYAADQVSYALEPSNGTIHVFNEEGNL